MDSVAGVSSAGVSSAAASPAAAFFAAACSRATASLTTGRDDAITDAFTPASRGAGPDRYARASSALIDQISAATAFSAAAAT